MSACSPRHSVPEALSSDRRSALPFLPTLATALVVAAASLLCRPTAAPEPAPRPAPAAAAVTVEAARAGADGFHPAGNAATSGATVPAVLAFARLHPPAFATDEPARQVVAAVPARPLHVAAQAASQSPVTPRKPCASTRCGEAHRAAEPVRAASAPLRPAPEPAAATGLPQPLRVKPETDDGVLPKGALPYAATAASWVDSVRKLGGNVGSEAASVGGAVVELLASLR